MKKNWVIRDDKLLKRKAKKYQNIKMKKSKRQKEEVRKKNFQRNMEIEKRNKLLKLKIQ